ncbi:ATP-binding protein [Arabiibacter massiliensis]|uniref:ATP-binding protein n=1 Tax=Arabiibacter massiliensis TaxID=1870985 RepID=UPI0009BC1450|nr:ATP-binding protein [Arabiibacter massiliensis]
MNEIILQTLRDFSLDDYRPIYRRDLDLGAPLQPRAGNLVKVVAGMRRCGKSYRLLQEMGALLRSGVSPDRMCYFNFEDERLSPVTPRTGDEVMETFYYLHPDALEQGAYFFFDEMQEMAGWGAWLRRIVDTRKATLYVSGSSSKMLSSEIATEFRGRALDFELLPYSFREICRIEGLLDDDSERGVFTSAQHARFERLFSSYLERGGFPAAQGVSSPQAIMLLQSYVQRVVLRDVVERHDLKRPRVATLFAQRALSSNGRQFSVRKTEGDFRSAGVTTSRELLSDLLEYFEEAYLLFLMKERAFSLAESSTTSPKVYAIDPGLALANARANTNDAGQRLENAVYLELRRRTIGLRREGIASLRTKEHGYEVDFVVGDVLDGDASCLWQVATRVDDPKTLDRELRALWEAMGEQGLEQATLIVGQGEKTTYKREGRRVEQVPAWQWFLQ